MRLIVGLLLACALIGCGDDTKPVVDAKIAVEASAKDGGVKEATLAKESSIAKEASVTVDGAVLVQ